MKRYLMIQNICILYFFCQCPKRITDCIRQKPQKSCHDCNHGYRNNHYIAHNIMGVGNTAFFDIINKLPSGQINILIHKIIIIQKLCLNTAVSLCIFNQIIPVVLHHIPCSLLSEMHTSVISQYAQAGLLIQCSYIQYIFKKILFQCNEDDSILLSFI